MKNSRRTFLGGIALLAAAGTASSAALQDPLPASRQDRKAPSDEPPPDNPNAVSPTKRALEDNEKEIKKKVDRLYELATELKAEVDKTDSSKVLSLALVKKAEEIEKLAKDIKTRSKG
jgi:hypothetical protein